MQPGGTEDQRELVISLPNVGPIDTQPRDVHLATIGPRLPRSDRVTEIFTMARQGRTAAARGAALPDAKVAGTAMIERS